MNRFDELWARALTDLDPALSRQGVTAADTREIIDLLRKQSFPSAVALLGTRNGDAGGPLGNQLLSRIAASNALTESGIDPATGQRLLTALFVHRTPPADIPADQEVLELLADAAANQLADQGIAVRPDEAHKIIELLATGEFFRDLGSATAAVMSTLPHLPIHLIADLPRTPLRIVQLGQAVARDLPSAAFQAPAVVVDLLDGTLDHPPALMTHTLTWLYDVASVRSTIEMIRTVIAPDNETVRLALVIYARANGIPLEPGDLDVLSNTVLNPDAPDLGPALSTGVDRLRSRYSQPQLEQILRRMAA
jgi:hypothetical protein